MATLVINRETSQDPRLSFTGSERIRVNGEANNVVLTPAVDDAETAPDEYDIDPADYPDTTAYLNAIPGMAESIIEGINAPLSEFEEWDWRKEMNTATYTMALSA